MILAVVQARMSSTRLPGKVMAPILGEPMIVRQLERTRRAKTLGRIIVATSTEPSDEPLSSMLESRGYTVVRGPLNDVLARCAKAAATVEDASHVVRMTADCPLIDPELIDEAVRLALASGADYTGNVERRSFPLGMEVEVVAAAALRAAAAEASDAYDREHVTPFLRRQPERFPHAHLTQHKDQSELRWSVDSCADFTFVRSVYEALYAEAPAFSSREVHELLKAHPELAAPRGDVKLAKAA